MREVHRGPVIERAPAHTERPEHDRPGWLRALLRVPLRTKIIGANLVIVVIAVVLSLVLHDWRNTEQPLALVMLLALIITLIVNVALVHVALRPIRALEVTAGRVWRGDLAARVPPSLVADRDMARVGNTVNLLLDGLTSDRTRMRQLASQVIRAQDEERSRIARELHDSAAQMLTALVLQLSVASRDAADADPGLAARLADTRTIASDALEEIRLLAHTMHPRVLDDLGIAAALHHLAAQGTVHAGTTVVADTEQATDGVPHHIASALYRVAQEAMRNAVRHGGANSVRLELTTTPGSATLEISDDGRGFDQDMARLRRPGMGLFTMRERMSLVDGDLEIDSCPGEGTRITASARFTPRENDRSPTARVEMNDAG